MFSNYTTKGTCVKEFKSALNTCKGMALFDIASFTLANIVNQARCMSSESVNGDDRMLFS